MAKNIDSQINNAQINNEWIYNYLHATYKTPTDIASTKYYNNGIDYNKIVSPLNINNLRTCLESFRTCLESFRK